MKLKTILDTKNNFTSTGGGTWRLQSAPSYPFTLTVNNNTSTYSQNDIISLSDNPDVQWANGEVSFTYTAGNTCPATVSLKINNINRQYSITDSINTTLITISNSAMLHLDFSPLNAFKHNLNNGTSYLRYPQMYELRANGIRQVGGSYDTAAIVYVYINKSDLPIGTQINTINMVDQFGNTLDYTLPNTIGSLNTNTNSFSNNFLNALNDALEYTSIQNNINYPYSIDVFPPVSGGFRIRAYTGPSFNYTLVIEIPVFVINPNNVSAPQYNINLDTPLTFKDTVNNVTIPYTIDTKNVYYNDPYILNRRIWTSTANNIAPNCTIAYTFNRYIKEYTGTNLTHGGGAITWEYNDTVSPSTCIEHTLNVDSTPVCNNGTYTWKDNTNATVSSTDTLITTKSGTYTVEFTCDDCIDCINTIPYSKSISI